MRKFDLYVLKKFVTGLLNLTLETTYSPVNDNDNDNDDDDVFGTLYYTKFKIYIIKMTLQTL